MHAMKGFSQTDNTGEPVLKLFVKPVLGKKNIVVKDLSLDTTIESIIKKIEIQNRFIAFEQRLVYKGNELKPEWTIRTCQEKGYPITEGTVLESKPRFRKQESNQLSGFTNCPMQSSDTKSDVFNTQFILKVLHTESEFYQKVLTILSKEMLTKEETIHVKRLMMEVIPIANRRGQLDYKVSKLLARRTTAYVAVLNSNDVVVVDLEEPKDDPNFVTPQRILDVNQYRAHLKIVTDSGKKQPFDAFYVSDFYQGIGKFPFNGNQIIAIKKAVQQAYKLHQK